MRYTLRIILRGDCGAYKGKNFKGCTIQAYETTFKSMRSTIGSLDQRNGDNESNGPIFDIYFIPLESCPLVNEYERSMLSIFPASGSMIQSPTGDETVVSRYACVGSSWHINTDGNQVEAVTF